MKTTFKSNIMKTTLLMLLFFGVLSTNAQTTHNLNWFNGITPEDASLTIEPGDTVIWTWTSTNHTVESVPGSAEEFSSLFLAPIGSTFSHTFTEVGTNDYVCGIHASMSGTITVEASSAGTTHNLNWFNGITPEDASLTIEPGDTVIWTWTSTNHTVESVPGSAEEFSSLFLAPIGSTFSHTFTEVGTNDYVCGIHASMSGTITVVESSLSVLDTDLAHFRIASNPTNAILTINLPLTVESGQLVIHDMLGKQVMFQDFIETQKLNIDVASLKQGLYLVSIKSGNKQQTQRFIKN